MYKVLVADDARVMRFATLRILKKLGLEAIEAEDGLQALELFEREKPDLVLIDVQMPGLDGLEVVRRIRAMSGEHWVPVIFLTSMEDESDFTRGIEAGGDDGPSSFRVEPNTHNDSWSSSPVGMCAGRWPACAHVHRAGLIRRMSPWALP